MIKSKEYEMTPGGPNDIMDSELYLATVLKVEREGAFFYNSNGVTPTASQFRFDEVEGRVIFLYGNQNDGKNDLQNEYVRVIFKY